MRAKHNLKANMKTLTEVFTEWSLTECFLPTVSEKEGAMDPLAPYILLLLLGPDPDFFYAQTKSLQVILPPEKA